MLTLAVALAVGQCCERLNVSMTSGDAIGQPSLNLKRVKFQDLGNYGTEADARVYGNITGEPEFTYVWDLDFFDINEGYSEEQYALLRYIPFWKPGEIDNKHKKIRTAVDNNPTWIWAFIFSFKTEECPENSGNWHTVLNFSSTTAINTDLDNPVPITDQNISITFTCLDAAEEEDEPLGAGAIAGIAVGGAVGLGAVLYGVYRLSSGKTLGVDGTNLL